jgi:hypothetical protein
VQPNSGTGLNVPAYYQSIDGTSVLSMTAGWVAAPNSTTGWSAEGWFMPTSLAHSHTMLSCGPNPTAPGTVSSPSISVTLSAMSDYNYTIALSIVRDYIDTQTEWSSDQNCLRQ